MNGTYTVLPVEIEGQDTSWAIFEHGADRSVRLVGHACGETPKAGLLDYLETTITDALHMADRVRAGDVLIHTA